MIKIFLLSNTKWSDLKTRVQMKVMFMNMQVYTCVHVTTVHEKESKEGKVSRGKGKGIPL